MKEEVLDYLTKFPSSAKEDVVRALVIGETLEEFFATPEGAALAESFINTIQKNILDIIEICSTDDPEKYKCVIMERGREISWCRKQLMEMAKFILNKDNVKE